MVEIPFETLVLSRWFGGRERERERTAMLPRMADICNSDLASNATVMSLLIMVVLMVGSMYQPSGLYPE